ncbi:DUF7351 domain-containing protein [Haloglomus litoreum]|uniref:DUF7351 domain-containing protein n=1 Tax=Haloglomus litoreum TaxID=3034026 RepID=UPI0023E8F54C|nr:ArsR family transcriptional regulator [Haloglomus sp. DT116]
MSDAVPGDAGTGDGADGEWADHGDPVTAASDAFAALGGETRMAIVRTLFEAEREAGRPVTRSFSTLFEASDEETTAGFAYHLRQLPETYLQKVEQAEHDEGAPDDEAGYRLTAAGRRVARAIAAGTLTESADRDPVDLEAMCPFCDESGLHAAGDDTVLTVACRACEREVLALPFPPAGYRAHDDGSLPDAVDSYYRGRIATMRDGTCPECGGVAETAAEVVGTADAAGAASASGTAGSGDDEPGDTAGDATAARARMTCTACGYRLRCPVTLTVLDEPAVVSTFHAAGVDLAERPLWNVGPEWRERVVSTDPLAIRVTARVGGEELACFVGRDLSVVYTDRLTPDDDGDDRRSSVGAGAGSGADQSVEQASDEPEEADAGADQPSVGEPDSATA